MYMETFRLWTTPDTAARKAQNLLRIYLYILSITPSNLQINRAVIPRLGIIQYVGYGRLNNNKHWFRYVFENAQGVISIDINPDSKAHEADMGPTWVLSVPDGPHVGPVNLAILEAIMRPHQTDRFLKNLIWHLRCLYLRIVLRSYKWPVSLVGAKLSVGIILTLTSIIIFYWRTLQIFTFSRQADDIFQNARLNFIIRQ